jgi:serine/threonine protein kinase
MPLGVPIRPPESQIISRKIVQGMVEGLQYLHGQHIVHCDIRFSNLILRHRQNDINMVIIDYETAYDLDFEEVQYSGGYICWPHRLLEVKTVLYVPEAMDGLYACILVVLTMLFPQHFDDFPAGKIRPNADPTQDTLKIIHKLLEIADCFCHV